jgi:thiosulfate dehydrogenase (quinone) large subunit
MQKTVNVIFLIIRIILGSLMFEAGFSKLASGAFNAVGFLAHSTGPFAGFYVNISQNPGILAAVNWLVPWGELLIGAALILGVAVRFASLCGIVQMLLFYTASLPPENGWISQAIVYMALFAVLMFPGTGYYFGLDNLVVKLEVNRHPLRLLLG